MKALHVRRDDERGPAQQIAPPDLPFGPGQRQRRCVPFLEIAARWHRSVVGRRQPRRDADEGEGKGGRCQQSWTHICNVSKSQAREHKPSLRRALSDRASAQQAFRGILPPLFATDTAIVGDTVGTVLLLEDEAHLREPLAHLLRLRHYNVVEVDTVDAALAAIRTERPDAAIVDVQVKDRSGHDVVVRMPPRAPVIIFSGMSAASGDLARLRPRTRVVEKPASLTWVIDSLDEMLQRTREFA